LNKKSEKYKEIRREGLAKRAFEKGVGKHKKRSLNSDRSEKERNKRGLRRSQADPPPFRKK